MRLIDLDTRRLKSIQVVADYRCGRRCDYCYNKLLGQTVEVVSDDLLRSLRGLISSAEDQVAVEIIGGEPLLKGVLPLTRSILHLLADHEAVSRISLTTAALESEAWPDVLPAVDVVYLSLDIGPDALGRNWKPLHDETLSALTSMAARNGADVEVAVTLSGSETTSDIHRFLNRTADAGVRRLGFSHVSLRPLQQTQVDAYAELFYELFRLRLAGFRGLFLGGAVLDNLDLSLRGGSRTIGCGCGVESVTIEPDGTISPGVLFDHALEGSVSHHDFVRMEDRRRDLLLETEPCASCELQRVCQGGCTGVAWAEAGSWDARELSLCDIQRALMARVRSDREALAARAVND